MVVPSSNVHKCRFDSGIGSDELRDLLQASTELDRGILRAIGGSVRTLVNGIDEFHGFKRFFSRRGERGIRSSGIHTFEYAGGAGIAYLKLIEIVHGNRCLL